MGIFDVDSQFLTHEPCPKCKSRDNLGVWSDGHKWCFGCGYYEHGERTIRNSRPRLEEKSGDAVTDILNNCTTDIPEKPLKWLKQYGITDEEIHYFVQGYESKGEYLYFRTFPGRFVGRYFGESKGPKYKTMGREERGNFYIGHSPYGIFCEDLISAIKIGRQYTACPVFGSHISEERLLEASRSFQEIGIWLDRDMVLKASRIAQKGALITGAKVFRVYSELDPKCYSDKEIREYVEQAKAG